MKPHRLKLYSGAAVGIVAGAPSKATRWRRTNNKGAKRAKDNSAEKYPKAFSPNGDTMGIDVINYVQAVRAGIGLPPLDEADILDALEAAEDAVAAKAAARKTTNSAELESAA